MSNEAINWALTRQIKHSSAKFVLVVMANCADNESWEAWPSVAHLSESTGQDRKTVLENIKRLIELGFISDTGERKGTTKQVPIYRLNEPENGTVKQSQKRNSTENGTVPFFPTNSPVFPHEQSRFSAETVPKTGHGTIKEPSKEPKENPKDIRDMPLPDWLTRQSWQNWVDFRKSIKCPLTPHAAKLSLTKLDQLRGQGHDPADVIDQSVMSGKWTNLYPIKSDRQGATPHYPARETLAEINARNNAEAMRLIEGKAPMADFDELRTIDG